MKKIICFLIFISVIQVSFAQEPTETVDTLRRYALKLFFDCPFCDEDYIRREIPFINYVRDRKEAQVHLMVTSQQTGGGGWEYSFHFFGQNEFEGQNDTLIYVSSTDDTREVRRKGQTELIKLGLMRYVAKTPLAKRVKIQFAQPGKEELVEDKWKSWVFNSSVRGFIDGQKFRRYYRIYGSIEASKVTPEWKYRFSLSSNIREDKIVISDSTIYSTLRRQSFYSLIVKSLGDHWSTGGRVTMSSSSFSNYKLKYSIYPGIEYDIFPYSESTRKQIRILYTIGYSYNHYEDTTIYNKIKESLFGQSLEIALEVTQKWGSVEVSANWSNYFHDWSKNHLSLYGYLNFRILKGLKFNMGGSVAMIHDQLALVKGGVSMEEILLYRKELETRYSYFTNFGITYTFGSIYSNVVNPRFGR